MVTDMRCASSMTIRYPFLGYTVGEPIPSPQIALPCDKTSSVANLLANITGLWNSISITDVPSTILFVFAAT